MDRQNVVQLMNAVEASRRRFLATLPDRVRTIARAALEFQDTEGARQKMGRLFHALSGTAATYGLGGIAAICVEAEALCDAPLFGVGEEAYLLTLLEDLHRLEMAHVAPRPRRHSDAA